ncbi:UNVERIFIED_CONTAM: hypothetical protein K2H54_061901 [Gekko kuhli]
MAEREQAQMPQDHLSSLTREGDIKTEEEKQNEYLLREIESEGKKAAMDWKEMRGLLDELQRLVQGWLEEMKSYVVHRRIVRFPRESCCLKELGREKRQPLLSDVDSARYRGEGLSSKPQAHLVELERRLIAFSQKRAVLHGTLLQFKETLQLELKLSAGDRQMNETGDENPDTDHSECEEPHERPMGKAGHDIMVDTCVEEAFHFWEEERSFSCGQEEGEGLFYKDVCLV